MTIFFPVPEVFPDPRARFIQIMNTSAAIAGKGRRIRLLVGLGRKYTASRLLEYYGLEPHPDLEIIPLPIARKEKGSRVRFSWHGVFNAFLVKHLLSNVRKGDLVFLRHLKLAGSLLGWKGILRVPMVFDSHEIFSSSAPDGAGRKKLERLEKSVYSGMDGLVTLTGHLREEILKIAGPGRTHVFVVPDGVRKEWRREPVELSPEGYIFYAGSLYPWKGVDVLIRAMEHLPGERLLVMGGGSRLEELKELARKIGGGERVSFTGQVSHGEVREHLFRAKAAVLPNIDDGPSRFSSPLKLFEYMAAGLPIVASDLPGFREALTDGEDALLVPPGDPLRLAEAIRRISAEPALAERIARAASLKSLDFTYEKRAEKLLDAFGQTMESFSA